MLVLLAFGKLNRRIISLKSVRSIVSWSTQDRYINDKNKTGKREEDLGSFPPVLVPSLGSTAIGPC